MKTRAAVAFEAGKPLEIVEVDLDGPKAGEVLVEIKATGLCHTDEFTRSGDDPEGAFPAILGHEGAGVVLEVGPGVTSLVPGDHVIPLYTPECRECEYCRNPKTNLCQKVRATQGKGLTCNWSNVVEKSGLQRIASGLGVMVIAPDTSPRGDDVPNDDAYDLGQGAGFYLSATQTPWSTHFQMDRYLVEELSALVLSEFPGDANRQGIMGHSMGGHGALVLHLKHPDTYRCVSALSPITSPMQVSWGEKTFTAYLGDERSLWADYDASMLVGKQPSQAQILIDTGDADPFLEEQLRPSLFIDACQQVGQTLNYRMQPGYDHSYWFIASLIEDHLNHHALILKD